MIIIIIIVMMIMMMMMIIMIMMIDLKGAIRDFLTISSLRRELLSTCTFKCPGRNRVQITCHTQSAHVVCHLVRRDSSAIKFDIAFILAFFIG